MLKATCPSCGATRYSSAVSNLKECPECGEEMEVEEDEKTILCDPVPGLQSKE